MEVERRRNLNNNKRKPLSNITNTIISPSTTTISNNTSTGSNNADTLNPKNSPTPHNRVDVHCENSKTAKVPSKRPFAVKAKDKGKAVAVVSSSCPPAKRSKTVGDGVQKGQRDRNKIYEEHSGISQSKPGTVYSWEREKEEDYSMSEEDVVFIDKQRAYFSEIDAFELLEEVVSESELE